MNITRIAPTPNGHLHLGNIFNFIHTYRLAKTVGAKLYLRIDDHDGPRCRPEFVAEILSALSALKISIDYGPSSVDEFYSKFTQTKKSDFYFSKLELLGDKFTCACSRKEVFASSSLGIYSGKCRPLAIQFENMKNVIRYSCPDIKVQFRESSVHLREKIGDAVLWRKDGLSSYQWMSVCEDLEMKTTHFVRGEDLLSSSAIQIAIAKSLAQKFPSEDKFYHHKLVLCGKRKMSKSKGDEGVVDRLNSDPLHFLHAYCDFFEHEKVSSLAELTNLAL